MFVGMGQHVVEVGEGPRMECLECGQHGTFDLKLVYHSLRLGTLGCAHSFRWLFQCRTCREAWVVKRNLVRELERAGVPITFLERDGLLIALTFLTLLLLFLRL